MFCANCGNKIEEGSKFCRMCGTVLPSAPPVNPESMPQPSSFPTQQIPPQAPLKKKHTVRNVLIVSAVVLVVLFGVPSMGSNLAVKVRYTDGSRKC
jgi:uncharacterized membrane protein YvbJ